MEAAIKSSLDEWTALAKSHNFLVQSFELLIASFSFLSMLPCLFVIAKTGTLHWNCKWVWLLECKQLSSRILLSSFEWNLHKHVLNLLIVNYSSNIAQVPIAVFCISSAADNRHASSGDPLRILQ